MFLEFISASALDDVGVYLADHHLLPDGIRLPGAIAVLQKLGNDVPGVCSFYLGLCLVRVLIDLGILDLQPITILCYDHEPFFSRLTFLIKNYINSGFHVSRFGEELN